MLSVANKPIMLSVFMLSAVMLCVFTLNVMAPSTGWGLQPTSKAVATVV